MIYHLEELLNHNNNYNRSRNLFLYPTLCHLTIPLLFQTHKCLTLHLPLSIHNRPYSLISLYYFILAPLESLIAILVQSGIKKSLFVFVHFVPLMAGYQFGFVVFDDGWLFAILFIDMVLGLSLAVHAAI